MDTQELAKRMIAACPGGVITMVIPFLNDDVPKYLDNLRRFYEESAKTVIVVSG